MPNHLLAPLLTPQESADIQARFIDLADQYSAALAFEGVPRVLLDNSILDALRNWQRGGGRVERRRAFAEFVEFLAGSQGRRPLLAITPTVLWEFNGRQLVRDDDHLRPLREEISALLEPLPCNVDLTEVSDFGGVDTAIRALGRDLEKVKAALRAIKATSFSAALDNASAGASPYVLAQRLTPRLDLEYVQPGYTQLVLAAIVQQALLIDRDLKARGLPRHPVSHSGLTEILKLKGSKLFGGGDLDLFSLADAGRQYAEGNSFLRCCLRPTRDSRRYSNSSRLSSIRARRTLGGQIRPLELA